MPEFLFYTVAIPAGFAVLGWLADLKLPCITKEHDK